VQSRPDKIAHNHALKKMFWTCFVASSERHMFLSERLIPVTVLNEYKLFPRSKDDRTIINAPLYKERSKKFFTPESSSEAMLREIICGKR
jgi:hypothetical protein